MGIQNSSTSIRKSSRNSQKSNSSFEYRCQRWPPMALEHSTFLIHIRQLNSLALHGKISSLILKPAVQNLLFITDCYHFVRHELQSIYFLFCSSWTDNWLHIFLSFSCPYWRAQDHPVRTIFQSKIFHIMKLLPHMFSSLPVTNFIIFLSNLSQLPFMAYRH